MLLAPLFRPRGRRKEWARRRAPAARLNLEQLEQRQLMDVSLGALAAHTAFAGAPVQFSGSSAVRTTGAVSGLTYHWDFGDGTASDAADVSHAYQAAGPYTATLSVWDDQGDYVGAETTVTVNPARLGPTIYTRFDAIPDFGAHPTIVSAHSGAWSDVNTWSTHRLPTDGDVVEIAPNSTVTYDVVSDHVLDTIVVDPGAHLQFRTDVNTRVVVANFLVKPGGWLEIGSEANPVAANVKAEVVFPDRPLNTSLDPEQYGNGLIGLGKVTMVGAQKTGFVRLASEAHAGDVAITLDSPVSGWQAGDKLVLPDTHQLDWFEQASSPDGYIPQYETVTLAGVSADGRTLYLSAPLRFDHLGSRDGAAPAEFLPHVANLSRNVMVKSANPGGTRGYTLFEDRADVDIRSVGFFGLGRTTNDDFDDATFADDGSVSHVGTNQEGRYAVTFRHLIGPTAAQADGYQYTFVDNAVTCPLDPMPFRWGVDINDSHYGLIGDNVLYNWAGAGLVTEAGDETGNVIEHNFVARINGDGERAVDKANMGANGEMGQEGAGFWFRGPGNVVRDNVATDIRGGGGPYAYGYVVYATYLGVVNAPAYQGADPAVDGQVVAVDTNATPLREFARNEVYGATYNGMSAWWLGAFADQPHGDAGVIQDLRVWNVSGYGYYGYESNNLTIGGFTFRGDTSLSPENWSSFGMWFSDYFQKGLVITNADIRGAQIGIVAPIYSDGLTVIENSYLKNQTDVYVTTTYTVNGSAGLPAKSTEIRNVRFGAPAGAASGSAFATIYMGYSTEGLATGSPTNVIQLDQVMVYDYNGVPGDDFQVYYKEQAPDYVVPQSGDPNNPDWPVGAPEVGAPVAGLTNQQCWDKYGIAIAGAVAPTTDTRDGIWGFVRKF
jgi:hypothetical protein